MRLLTDASITNQEYQENTNVTLKRLQHFDLNNVIFSYLNISSIRSKVGDLNKIEDGNINTLCIADIKLDESFPSNKFVYQYNQFNILAITDNNGDLMVFVKSHIPSKMLNGFKIPYNIQIIPFEINLREEKQLVGSIYNAPSHNSLEFQRTRYEKVIILGDFNIEAENSIRFTI